MDITPSPLAFVRPVVPTHHLPDALVADETGGDEPVAFVLPDDLTAETVTDEDLATLEADAIAAFDRESATPTPTAATLTTCTNLQAAITEVRNEAERRMTEATATADQLATLRGQVHADQAADEGGDGADGGEGGGDGGDDGGDGGGDGDGAEGADGGGEGADAPETVLASGAAPRRIPLSNIRDRAPGPVIPDPAGSPVNITAASGIQGFDAGQRLESADEIGRAMHAAVRGMSDGQRGLVASVEVPTTLTIGEAATRTQMAEAVAELTSPAAIEEALVAAGGWCAPNDRMWEFFDPGTSATAGILDVPTMTIERAGLDFPVSPSLADVFAVPGIAWEWTEADDIAALGNPHEDPADDVAKPCFRIPCPTWDSAKLTALGLCMTHGNLSNRAYPENTARWVELALAAHAHRLNAIRIARMVAGSTPVTIGTTPGAIAPILNAVDLQAHDVRDKYRLDPNAVVETVFPMWTTGVMRADLARRTGVDMSDVTEAMVRSWFAERQVSAQFVYDWQSLQLGAAGADGFREVWPAQVQFLQYIAGTWVRGTGGRIDLAVGQDSGAFRGMDQVKVNDYTAAWSEEFDLTAKVGHESRLVTVQVCPNGVTSAAAVAPACPVA